MEMRLRTQRDYRAMPWRNGGGTTTELVVEPAGAGVGPSAARFFYRVSIADVSSDGPFSRFEGYDRHIMLLEGAGMTLDCGSHGRIDLSMPLAPRTFSGDWEVYAALVAGPVRDFNLIVDRARASSSLEVRSLEAPEEVAVGSGDVCVAHVLTGALEGADDGDTLVVEETFELVPRSRARVAVARIGAR